ncbi:glutamyl-tRNA amidotransferase subunit A [Aspergillus steynii IBT 23096]|uniref:Glutamyl-tRNA amidotransferase subunit A n=1 Tax=Aspergillus steynii IBT 23096 TaxID=1392250 RepID=A0A2I2GD82_9EURO|nr:glutamyl-tRNA amidotransferase subunit A [Aspergillus steynii IBT 23096]PLB50856.1 glutamyl-tRNA amidotransferase subunit A [Aspergillus steynii IBT 23096]
MTIKNRNTSWQETAKGVQAVRDDSIAQVQPAVPELPQQLSSRVIDIPRQLLSPSEVEITETSAEGLVTSLAEGKITATAVTQAFLRRAAIAQKLTNCIYELLPERALARAKELDEYFAKHGKPSGSLHGLPISVKGHVGIAGRDNTAGFVGWVGRKSPDDANVLKILLKAGAVIYARTTEPQGLMALETCSNITGNTVNPHNTALSAGGSSGGESALQALHGSPLGIGSDIGGSIRSPAANCGLYGLKPTAGRLPIIGVSAYVIGCETILGTIGPLSPTLEGISLFMKTVLDAKPWLSDPTLHQIPWRGQEPLIYQNKKRKLTVGVMWEDGVVKPTPPVTRALQETVDRLKSIPGIEVIEWKPYQQTEALEILTRLYAPDGGKAFAQNLALSGEPYLPLLEWTLRDTPGIEELDLHGVWGWTLKREVFRYKYLQAWNSIAPEMDVILCPAHPSPAPVIDTSRYWGYTSIWNLLDYPAIVFPVTRVDPGKDEKDTTYTPRNEHDSWCHEHYDARKQINAPVSLQLVGKKFEDEKVVQALTDIKEKTGLPFVDCFA